MSHRIPTFIVAAALVAGGCGGSSSDKPATPASTVAQASATPYGLYVRTVTKRDIARTVKLPDMHERLSQFGAEPIASSPEDFAALARAEHDKFARLVRAAGIQPE